MMNFTVIIPCYKQAHFLARTIDSVIAQTLPNVEIIVVNDGSPDNTDQVARTYGSKITYLAKKNGGVASARNYGLKYAHGRMILFLDSDNTIAPDMLEKQYEASLNNPDKEVFFGDCVYVDSAGRPIGNLKISEPPEDVFHWLLRQNRCPPCCISVRRDTLDNHGPFLSAPNCYGHEDWELWLRYAAKGCGFMHVPGALAYYRRHPASLTLNPFVMWNSGYTILNLALKHHENCPECREICAHRHCFLDQSCVELLRQQFRLHLRKGEIIPILKLIPRTMTKGPAIWMPLARNAFSMIKRVVNSR